MKKKKNSLTGETKYQVSLILPQKLADRLLRYCTKLEKQMGVRPFEAAVYRKALEDFLDAEEKRR